MRSADEWMKIFLNGQEPQDESLFYGSEASIEAIQADALEAAAIICFNRYVGALDVISARQEARTAGELCREIRALKAKVRAESHGRPVYTEAEIRERGWPYGPEKDL